MLMNALMSIAITSIMITIFMSISDHMNKSKMSFARDSSRNIYELQIVGALTQANICSCNLKGLTVDMTPSSSTAIQRLTTAIQTCPLPSDVKFDLFDSTSAAGFELDGGLKVDSISLIDVINVGQDNYQGQLKVEYKHESKHLHLRPRKFTLYFTRDTADPGSTPTSPVIDTCALLSPPNGAADLIGYFAGSCTELYSCGGTFGPCPDPSSNNSSVIPSLHYSTRYVASPAYSENFGTFSKCRCSSGFDLHLLMNNHETSNGIQKSTTTYVCRKVS